MRAPMDAIVLLYRGEMLRAYGLGARGLEVGSAAGCDVVVPDPDVAERSVLVRESDGQVVAVDLRATGAKPVVMRPGEPLALSERSAIMRVREVETAPATTMARTEPIAVHEASDARLALVLGRGSEARRIAIGTRPLLVGTASDCDVHLVERAVSARHCRIEPTRDGLVVRDLDSRNGTYVDGVRSFVASIGAGTRLRVGRTDLRVVARGEKRDANESGFIASSPAMLEVLAQVEQYAPLSMHALVLGESGAGKENVAKALHFRGPRRDKPFVDLSAAALPANLIESELFGHEKGAFTGAATTRRGVFEQADGGTLFLDEIGELSLDLQTRLLRVLETREVRRVGSEQTFRVDVRVVAATHRDLHEMIDEGTFRLDLYYRLAGLQLRVPPLRERPEDVRALALHFAATHELGPRAITEDALAQLVAYAWPGNVRELKNVVGSAGSATAGVIDARDVVLALERMPGPRGRRAAAQLSIVEVVERCGGNLTAASRTLGIPRTTLRDRLRVERTRKRGR